MESNSVCNHMSYYSDLVTVPMRLYHSASITIAVAKNKTKLQVTNGI